MVIPQHTNDLSQENQCKTKLECAEGTSNNNNPIGIYYQRSDSGYSPEDNITKDRKNEGTAGHNSTILNVINEMQNENSSSTAEIQL